MPQPIYLDHNATTPVAAEVLSAMLPYLERHFGNPSSSHAYGVPAHEAVERARAQVAALLGCEPDSIVFTASGSEANNLAVKGVTVDRRREGEHIITTAIEHPAVLNACRYLERRHGHRLTIVAVGQSGLVDPDEIRSAIQPGTGLISVMHANAEPSPQPSSPQWASAAAARSARYGSASDTAPPKRTSTRRPAR